MSKYFTKKTKTYIIVLIANLKNGKMVLNNKIGDFMIINKKTIISICLCIVALFMAVGYSVLVTELKIVGGANITSSFDVRITGITNSSSVGSAYNLEGPSFTNDTAKFKVVLVNPGDSMVYNVSIENKGTITAILNEIDISTSGSDAIFYKISGIAEGETLAVGESVSVVVEASYNSNMLSDPDESMKTLKVRLNWLQYTN